MLVYADLVFFCLPLAMWLMAMTTLSRFTFRGRELLLPALKLTFLHLPIAVLITVVALISALVVYLFIVPAAYYTYSVAKPSLAYFRPKQYFILLTSHLNNNEMVILVSY